MRALVTGGAGFIGSHVVERLLARGDDVVVVDNFATGLRSNLPEHDRLRIVEDTIADEDAVGAAFRMASPDVIVHAAASYSDPEGWTEDSRTNAVGTAAVVREAERHGVRRLVYFQTALCYGLQPQEHPITLAHPLNPAASSYAISKTAGEHYVRLSGLDWISLRLANAYGPRNLSGPLPTFWHRLTAGEPCFVADTRRDFIFVDDVVDVVMKALDGNGRSGVYHVSSGGDIAISELFAQVVRAIGIAPAPPVDVRPRGADDAPSILLDPSETRRAFGWEARVPLERGVDAAVAHYEKAGVERTYTHLHVANQR